MKIFKRLLRLSVISILGLMCFAIGASGDQTFFRHWYPSAVISIDPDIAEELISNSDVLILDVREKEEYQVSRLQNATMLDQTNLEGISKNRPILLYCTVGYRSALAAETLQNKGFKNIYNLDGGLIFWKNLNGDVFDSSAQKTDSVHVFNKFYSLWLKNGIATL